MKRNFLLAIILMCSSFSFAQNRMGIELGAARPVFANGSYTEVPLPRYGADYVLTGNINYLRKASKHWYWGGKIAFEQYSFNFGTSRADAFGGVKGTNVIHKSSYLHIAPMVDFGIGKHRQYLHVYSFASLGFLLSAFQETNDYYNTYDPQLRMGSVARTDYQVNSAVFRFGIGLKQQFPLTNTWQAVIDETYSFMPFGDVSQPNATGGANLHPGYISLQFGVMHKFKDARHAD